MSLSFFSTTSLNWYRIALFCVFAIQAVLIFSIIAIPSELIYIKGNHQLSPVFLGAHSNYNTLMRIILIVATLFLIVLMGDSSKRSELVTAFTDSEFKFPLVLIVIQFILFFLLYWQSKQLSGLLSNSSAVPIWLDLSWGLTCVIFSFISLLLFAPMAFYRWFLTVNTKFLALAFVTAALVLIVSIKVQFLWQYLAEYTLAIVVKTLALFYSDVQYIAEQQIVKLNSFKVIINKECSGYEGMVLVSCMIMVYLWLFRHIFRFPRSFVLLPVGMLAIWLLNSVRITLLIIIGEEISPDVAIGGFHSHAGWIAFLLVSLVLLYAGSKIMWFRSKSSLACNPRQALISKGVDIADLLLWPFIVLMVATIVTGAASAGFQWFYPLRVIFVVITLCVFWPLIKKGFSQFQVSSGKAITMSQPQAILAATSVGFIAFVIWVALITESVDDSAVFAQNLFTTSSWLTVLWLIFRVIGSCITVPIAEEFAFRGYFLQRLAGTELGFSNKMVLPVFSIACTSIAFGLLHDAWLAGTVVGVLYGLVRIYGGHLYLAIMAHATTNICLTVYVLSTQQWSLW